MLTGTWKKSTKSSPSGDNCLEARIVDGVIEVRNSRRPEAGSVSFDTGEWQVFLYGAKNGEFDI